jgi:CheY-like chemotaxis protein
MDKETQAQVFEPFFTTKGVGHGTGLGLATVYGIVKQNKGFIEVHSLVDKGTIFKIYFPRHIAATAEKTIAPAETKLRGGNETVLLVEDELSILNLGRAILEPLGYQVMTAQSPKDAIRLAADHKGPIQLLITDVVMPGMNGRELAEHLVTIRPEIKCVFMSGYTANIIEHQGVFEEGLPFVHKPFTARILAEKIREVLDQTK